MIRTKQVFYSGCRCIIEKVGLHVHKSTDGVLIRIVEDYENRGREGLDYCVPSASQLEPLATDVFSLGDKVKSKHTMHGVVVAFEYATNKVIVDTDWNRENENNGKRFAYSLNKISKDNRTLTNSGQGVCVMHKKPFTGNVEHLTRYELSAIVGAIDSYIKNDKAAGIKNPLLDSLHFRLTIILENTNQAATITTDM